MSGLEWNEKKCNVVHVRKGIEVNATRFKAGQLKVDCIKDGTHYKFLGAPERLLQNEKLTLSNTANVCLQMLYAIWSSPLSDGNGLIVSNQFALPELCYLMKSLHWNVTDLRNIDKQVLRTRRKEPA